MVIDIVNLIVSGDCSGTSSGFFSFDIVGTTPPFGVTCISPILTPPLPTSGGTTSYSVSGLSANTYFLQIVDGGSYSEIRTIYISSGTTATIDSIPTSCGLNNGVITGFTSGAYGDVTFSLFNESDNLLTSVQTSNPYYEFTSLSAGTYYIIANDGGGCTGITASVILTPSVKITVGTEESTVITLAEVVNVAFLAPIFPCCGLYDNGVVTSSMKIPVVPVPPTNVKYLVALTFEDVVRT